jgi:hypothetical protein
LPIITSLVLILPLDIKDNNRKAWEWLWLLIKFYFKKQSYIFERNKGDKY